MGERCGCRGKGILKAEFQTRVSPWVKLHREIFWQNPKGTEMKARPGIYIANDIRPGGTARLAPARGRVRSAGPEPRFPAPVWRRAVQGDRLGVTWEQVPQESREGPVRPPSSSRRCGGEGSIGAGQTARERAGGARVDLRVQGGGRGGLRPGREGLARRSRSGREWKERPRSGLGKVASACG